MCRCYQHTDQQLASRMGCVPNSPYEERYQHFSCCRPVMRAFYILIGHPICHVRMHATAPTNRRDNRVAHHVTGIQGSSFPSWFSAKLESSPVQYSCFLLGNAMTLFPVISRANAPSAVVRKRYAMLFLSVCFNCANKYVNFIDTTQASMTHQ